MLASAIQKRESTINILFFFNVEKKKHCRILIILRHFFFFFREKKDFWSMKDFSSWNVFDMFKS